ncbi:MAG: hypothetical protein ACTSRW_15385 [Candidatus Helarchaeota archaeon]
MHDKTREIQRLLKIAGGQYLKESAEILNRLYFSGNYQEEKIDNRLLAGMMDISTTKASKILSSLARVDLIQKAPEENAYFTHEIDTLCRICLEQLKKSWQADIRAINSVFSRNFFAPFVENINMSSMYQVFKEMFRITNLRNDLYLEINSGGPACNVPFDSLDLTTQKILKQYFSKVAYDIFHERYLALKWRLEEQRRRGIKEGTVYYIINVRAIRSIVLKISEKKGLDPIHVYLTFLKNLESFFKNFYDFLLDGHLQVIIDTEHKNINGPLVIFENNAYLCLIENPNHPGNDRILYFHDAEIVQILTTSYRKLFENIMRAENYKEQDDLPNFLLREERGKWLYESQTKKLRDEIRFIEDTYLKE